MKILYSFPSRSRPEKFKAAMDNIKAMSASKDYMVVVKGDTDDKTMNNADMWEWLSSNHYGNYVVQWGTSKSKIHAMNRDLPGMNFDILIAMSDDMVFTVKGFDDIIRDDMHAHFPDGDGVLHYNDGMQKSNVMTMSIMGRKYFDRTGYIYHPDYTSVWCDVEATEVAYMLNLCYHYCGNDKIIFRHLHPVWGLTEWDEQYRSSENPELYNKDKEVILRRRARKYDLNPEEIVNEFKYPATL